MDSDEMYFGLYNTKMMWITLAVAVMIAFQGYGFLLQAKTVDFYYSLPVKRSHLFGKLSEWDLGVSDSNADQSAYLRFLWYVG